MFRIKFVMCSVTNICEFIQKNPKAAALETKEDQSHQNEIDSALSTVAEINLQIYDLRLKTKYHFVL